MAALNFFTYQASKQVTAQTFPQATALPAGSTPSTLIVSVMSGGPCLVTPTTAVATTTASGTNGQKAITVAAGTSIAAGQLVVAAGVPDGTTVSSISGTAVVLSQSLTADLSTTAINFIAYPPLGQGVGIIPGTQLPLAYASNTFLVYASGYGYPAQLNIAVGV